jgi:hypothetical protein
MLHRGVPIGDVLTEKYSQPLALKQVWNTCLDDFATKEFLLKYLFAEVDETLNVI